MGGLALALQQTDWLMGDAAVFLVLFTIACVLTLILQCIPIEAAWDFKKRLAKGTKCYSGETYLKIGKFNSGMSDSDTLSLLMH